MHCAKLRHGARRWDTGSSHRIGGDKPAGDASVIPTVWCHSQEKETELLRPEKALGGRPINSNWRLLSDKGLAGRETVKTLVSGPCSPVARMLETRPQLVMLLGNNSALLIAWLQILRLQRFFPAFGYV
ncbi:hypothetical protein P7K49_032001 [Saguinus oedipus]|uniref:Uncharacterized protein n=1 Tax=Saguinus oedipus TaxID=9490 RepID=A0ABQ9TXY6_SAGOE|nr:hypothetical protein P7K49_032001 [Saguinus oedipus]